MPREVVIDNSTFIINSFSRPDATETVEDILKRVIVKNAEAELKKHPYKNKPKADNSQPK